MLICVFLVQIYIGFSLFFTRQIAFMVVVYPSLVLAYMGEAAYLTQHRKDLQSSFYKAIPGETCYQKSLIPLMFTYWNAHSEI